jgi:hypothetical protein
MTVVGSGVTVGNDEGEGVGSDGLTVTAAGWVGVGVGGDTFVAVAVARGGCVDVHVGGNVGV